MNFGLPSVRALAASAALSFLLSAAAAPAQASPETLRMACGNLFGGPLDAALSPATATLATLDNLPYVSDEKGLQAAYALFGWPGQLVVQSVAGVLRTGSGALQLLPAVALFPFNMDLKKSMDPLNGGDALVDLENPLAENPSWLKWVPIATPFTIDPKFGITAPIGVFGSDDSEAAIQNIGKQQIGGSEMGDRQN